MRPVSLTILKTLYDVSGGRVGVPIDVVDVAEARVRGVRREDVARIAAELASRGLVTLGRNGSAAMTGLGIRALWMALSVEAQRQYPVPTVSYGADNTDAYADPNRAHEELEIEEIMQLIEYDRMMAETGEHSPGGPLANNRPPPPRPVQRASAPAAQSADRRPAPTSEQVRLTALREELERITKNLYASGSFQSPRWSESLDATKSIEEAIATLEEMLSQQVDRKASS